MLDGSNSVGAYRAADRWLLVIGVLDSIVAEPARSRFGGDGPIWFGDVDWVIIVGWWQDGLWSDGHE